MKRPLFKAAAFVAALVAGAWLHAAPPPNDSLDSPQVLTGDSGELTADTSEATREEAEDYLDFSSSQHTVWYKWTASKTGFVSFDTLGSDFDTVLAAYIDINSGAVARNDDFGEDYTSRIAFFVQAGQTCLIRAGGYGESYGQLMLRWSLADVQELTLTGDSGVLISDMSEEEGDYASYKVYRWTAQKTGPAYFKLKSDGVDYETEFAVYTNSIVVADGSSYVGFCAQAGQTYVILATLWDYEGDCQKQTIMWHGELAEGEWRILATDGIVFGALGDLPEDLKAADFPAGVTTIAEGAFEDVEGVKFVTIPATVTKIDDYAFAWADDLEWVDYEGGATAAAVSDTAFFRTPYALELPFKLILDEGVYTNVEWDAGCTVATTNIEPYCIVEGFVGTCPWEVVIPEGVTEVSSSAFSSYGNEGLVKVTFPSTLKWVEGWAFYGCDELEQVAGIPATAIVDDYAFYGSLYEKVRPFELVTYEKVEPDYDSYDWELGMYTKYTTNTWVSGFHGACPETVMLPEGIYGINEYAFSVNGTYYGNRRSIANLKKVVLASTVKDVSYYAFAYLPNLEEVVFRGKKEDVYIDDFAFYATPYAQNNVEEQEFALTMEYWDSSYWDSDKGEYVSTSNLWVTGYTGTVPEEIVIPDGVYGINYYAFQGLEGVTAVTIPASVREIGNYAFANCADLASVTFKGNKDEINAYYEYGLAWAFLGTPYSATFDFHVLYSIYPGTTWHYEPVYSEEFGWTVTSSASSETTNCYVYGYVGTCPAKLDLEQLLTNKNYYASYEFDTVVFSANAFAGTETLTELVLPRAKYRSLTESYSWDYDSESGSWRPHVFQYYNDTKAFRYCPNLAKVTISGDDANNKELLTDVFQGTPWLDKVVPFEFITEDVVSVQTNIEEEVVGNCSPCVPCEWKAVTNVTTTTTRKIVGFYGNVPSKLTFPEDVGEIDAVYYWKSGNTYSLKGGMFEGCENLTEVVVPGNVKRVGQRAFAQCVNLQNVEFEEGVESIGYSLFYGCGDGAQVILPTSACNDYAVMFDGIDGDVDVLAPRQPNIYDRAFKSGDNYGRTCVEYYTLVVLDANGGTFEGETAYRCFDDVLTGLPTPTLAGSVFRGWWDDDDTLYDNGYVWGENDARVYLTAEWALEKKFTVYGLDGSTEIALGEGDDYETLLRVLEDAYGGEPQPSRHGLTFRYWTVDGEELNHRSVIGQNSTFGAYFDKFNPLSDHPEDPVDGAAAQTYDGYILDNKGNNAGTIQVKVGKPNKDTEANVSAKLQMFGEAKLSFKADPKGKWKLATTGATTGVTLFSAKATDKIVIDISEKGIFGTYGTYDIIGSRNTSKKDAAYANWVGKKYDVAFKTKEGTGSAFTGGYSGVTVSIANKGKVKISGVMADGAKVNASAQLLISDKGEGCVNVFVPMYSGKKGGFGFVLWINPDYTTASVESISVWKSTDNKSPFTAELELVDVATPAPASEMAFTLEAVPVINGATVLTEFLPKSVKAAFNGVKITVAKANNIKVDRAGVPTRTGTTDNDAALKLNYMAKDGSFKGSFTVYTLVNSKLKKVKANVNGVFIGGAGYGTAVIKGVGSFPVSVR